MSQHHQIGLNPEKLVKTIKAWGLDLGFQQIGIAHTNLANAEDRLQQWLRSEYHGTMAYMSKHGLKRSRPQLLIPGTVSIICVAMNYWPEHTIDPIALLKHQDKGYISRYAIGRDYHKVLRKRLQSLANHIEQGVGPFQYRVFTDSGPVLEKPLAQHAGLGWIGKHSNLINRKKGSWFFLGEIYSNLSLPADAQSGNHCGNCQVCIDVCPTGAIIAPYVLDARLCISYLTIEYKGSIPVQLRPLMGNRIYGCDDCQLFCPWNRFSQASTEDDFQFRSDLQSPQLLDLLSWSEKQFEENTQGSAIGRIGYNQWLRNIAVALGNASPDAKIVAALEKKCSHPSDLVQEHASWAFKQQTSKI